MRGKVAHLLGLAALVVAPAVSASADMAEADIVSVTSSANLSGPPDWPIVYQPVSDYSAIDDGSLATGIEIVGGENVENVNGLCDSGGALRISFQTAVQAQTLYLDVWLGSYAPSTLWPGPFTGMTMYDAADYHALHWIWLGSGFAGHDGENTGAALHFAGTFDTLGNTFNGEPSVTINDIRLPGNRFLLTLWGPYMASVHDDGSQGLIVYEVHAWYEPVPEPTALLLLAIGVLVVRRRGVPAKRKE